MISSNFTQPQNARCGWCGDLASGDHGPCVVALRNLGLGYCAACGGALGNRGQQHDQCMVFLTGRTDLLDPSPEDLARLQRLLAGLAEAIDDRECTRPAVYCWCGEDRDSGDHGRCVIALRNAGTATPARAGTRPTLSSLADQARWN